MSTQDDQFLNITITPIANPDDELKIPTADVVICLDESGSMIEMGNEPVEAVQEFIEKQKNTMTDPDARLSLYTFNTEVKCVYREEKLANIPKFDTYYPSGMTSLYECVHMAIAEKLQGSRENNVSMVIVTDGRENTSKPEYNKQTLTALINKVEKLYNWNVMFLGANIDAFDEGTSIGAKMGHCAQFNQQKYGDLKNILRTTSDACTHYRRSAYANKRARKINLGELSSAPPLSRQ